MVSQAFTCGDTLPFGINLYDPAGSLANGGTVTVTVTKPDGTVDGPHTVTPAPTGTYAYSFAGTDLDGRYLGLWAVTGVGGQSEPLAEPQAFYVSPAAPVVTLDELKKHLRSVSADDDGELNILLATAVGIVEDLAGPIKPKSYTEVHEGGDVSIYLRHTPVISVGSITELIALVPYTLTEQPVGQSTSNYGFSIDSKRYGKIVRRAAGSIPVPFSNSLGVNGIGTISVTYTAGRQQPSEKVRMAVKEAARFLWKSRTSSTSDFASANYTPQPGALFGVPKPLVDRLLMLLGSDERKGVVLS